jgi:hypothetical protein
MKASPDRAGHRAANARLDRPVLRSRRPTKHANHSTRRRSQSRIAAIEARVSPCTIAEARIADQGAEQFVLELTVAGD